MDSEITAHEQLINTVMSTADQLIESEHYAADEIEVRCAELQEKWAELTSLSATRHQNLQESLKAQQVRNTICLSTAWNERQFASGYCTVSWGGGGLACFHILGGIVSHALWQVFVRSFVFLFVSLCFVPRSLIPEMYLDVFRPR